MIHVEKYGIKEYANGVVYGKGFKAAFGRYDVITSLEEGTDFNRDDYPYMGVLGDEWECGHLFAKRFGGKGESENLIPMKSSLNIQYRDEVENVIAKLYESFYVLSSELMIKANIVNFEIEYEVRVSSNTVRVNTIEIPESISVNIRIYTGNNIIDYQKVNSCEILKENNIKLPIIKKYKLK